MPVTRHGRPPRRSPLVRRANEIIAQAAYQPIFAEWKLRDGGPEGPALIGAGGRLDAGAHEHAPPHSPYRPALRRMSVSPR